MPNVNKLSKLRDLKCVICGKEFQRHISPSEIKQGRGKVCSKECKKKFSSISNKRGEFRKCEKCGQEFWSRPSEDRRNYKKRFCSVKCFSEYPKCYETKLKLSTSLKKVIHTSEWNEKVRLSKIGSKNAMWKHGEEYGGYGDKWGRELKNRIRLRDNDICKICFRTSEGKQRHPIHHIDFDKKNNSDDNLMTVCRSCHRKIHTGKIKHD